MYAGTEIAYSPAKKYKIRTAFGSDTLFDAKHSSQQGAILKRLMH